MPHVMVPCPEEHLGELTVGLMRLQLGMGGWDDDSLGVFLSKLDPLADRLIQHVARASEAHDRVPYREVAGVLGIDVGELLDLVTAVNDQCRRDEQPLPLITDTRSDTSATGEPVATPVLVIPHHVAARIVALRTSTGQADHDLTTP